MNEYHNNIGCESSFDPPVILIDKWEHPTTTYRPGLETRTNLARSSPSVSSSEIHNIAM
jgi:hypothetical protein